MNANTYMNAREHSLLDVTTSEENSDDEMQMFPMNALILASIRRPLMKIKIPTLMKSTHLDEIQTNDTSQLLLNSWQETKTPILQYFF